ncbi:DUF2971 domain-containing protein [Pseudoflavonifractor sp. An85]|uniref:DUF2971 domain-containing protein n=1 Tax=Pseudoflavonifractor sp. An85 TaxID=1965661 RepID=UPI000B3A7CEB|nr:DUF2971 domain-containing protein [Pseudoflavonifractor sp. An85]OUN19221.1 hypothetical protein B5G37_13725 [Pseudoflavonifractor sp. An85]
MKSQLEKFVMKLSMKAIPNNANYSGEIFHYTALKNIESMLLGPKDHIVLWASQFDCLNDFSEGTVVDKIYREVCHKLKNESLISEELFNAIVDVNASPNETFLVRKNGKLRIHRGEYTTYIASFSHSNDLLPMWNYYSKGDMFEGINLGMNAKSIFSNLINDFVEAGVSIEICPVIYTKEDQEKLMREFLLEIAREYDESYNHSVRAIVSMKLTSWKMLFKQKDFQHEQEVRIIVKVANKFRDVLPVKYRTNSGYIIPYIELEIDKTAMESVTLGPFRGTENQRNLQVNVLKQLLASNGYDVAILSSQVPVRY